VKVIATEPDDSMQTALIDAGVRTVGFIQKSCDAARTTTSIGHVRAIVKTRSFRTSTGDQRLPRETRRWRDDQQTDREGDLQQRDGEHRGGSVGVTPE
jgi:hypothetical protein